ITVVDAEGGVIRFINKTEYGIDANQFIGRRIYDTISPEFHEEVRQKLRYTFETGNPTEYINSALIGDKYFWYENRLGLIHSGDKKDEVMIISSNISKRIQAEEEIRESRERMKVLLSNLPGMAYRCLNAPGWPMVFVSEGCYALTGYRPKDFTSGGPFQFEDIINPDDRAYVNDTIQEYVSKGLPFTIEYRITTKNGIEKRVWEKGRQVSAGDGSEKWLEGFIMDITERIQAEEALKRSEEKYSKIFKTSPNAIVITRLSDGMILDLNPGFERVFGYSRKEAYGNTSLLLKLWGNPEDRAEVVSDLQKKKKVYNREYPYRKKNGEMGIGLYTAELITIMDELCIISSVNDITERKMAEKALQESEKKLMSIFRVSPSGIGMVKDRIITEVSDRICEMTGYLPHELIGESSRFLYPTQMDFEFVGSEKYRQIREKGIGVVETRWKRKDGEIIDIILASTPMIPGDNSKGVIFTALDVTDWKKAEMEQRIMQEQLIQAQKMETIGQLAGGVAHEFNNTLQIINTFAELSLMKLDEGHPISQYLQQIRTSVKHSSDFVGQLLAFARKQTVKPEVLSINEFVNGMIIMLQRLIGDKILLEWQPGDSIWQVKLDPAQVNQLLVNLTLNARDALSDNGKILISTTNETCSDTTSNSLGNGKPGEYVMLAISDNGCGMDKEKLSRIFEPFYTTKAKGKGTGLGLATVYGIVRQNGGFIVVDSSPGEGSAFKLYFPRYKG
ncbi:MAG: PAS domain S-box protein, partial [Bacteroidales bacterium]|nr:PAS domain S-box protein [Bacteroidales bacterium]